MRQCPAMSTGGEQLGQKTNIVSLLYSMNRIFGAFRLHTIHFKLDLAYPSFKDIRRLTDRIPVNRFFFQH